LLRCGRKLENGSACNAKLYGAPARKTHAYRCRSLLDGGCNKRSRQGPAIDKLIKHLVLAKLEKRSAKRKQVAEAWSEEPKLADARRRKGALEAQWAAAGISDSTSLAFL
ncbi:recombinase zinc beta ribbon domain-containing protein, partial [Saccharothrix sp. ST-888]|uniref:recombinase zinc beta ribbon domain-containing protein n=1 Tax=Saccharothrix sp. ST-888 TaxID=1427391 RepID=UPI0005ECC71D